MPRSVTITTPIPTLEELRTSLGVSKSRVRSLIRIMDQGGDESSSWKSANGRPASSVDGASRRGSSRRMGRSSAGPAGKSKRASAGR